MKKYLPLGVEGWEAHPWRETPISRGVSTSWIRAAGVHLCHANVFGKWPWHLSWLFIPSVDSLPLAISSWSHCARAQQSKYFGIFAIFLEIASSFNFLFIYFFAMCFNAHALRCKAVTSVIGRSGDPSFPNITIWGLEWGSGSDSGCTDKLFLPYTSLVSSFYHWATPKQGPLQKLLNLGLPFPGIKMFAGITRDRLRLACAVSLNSLRLWLPFPAWAAKINSHPHTSWVCLACLK